jgi:hypothetical protein
MTVGKPYNMSKNFYGERQAVTGWKRERHKVKPRKLKSFSNLLNDSNVVIITKGRKSFTIRTILTMVTGNDGNVHWQAVGGYLTKELTE